FSDANDVLVGVLREWVESGFFHSARVEPTIPSCAAAALMTAAPKKRRRLNLVSSEVVFIVCSSVLLIDCHRNVPVFGADISQKFQFPAYATSARSSPVFSGKRI